MLYFVLMMLLFSTQLSGHSCDVQQRGPTGKMGPTGPKGPAPSLLSVFRTTDPQGGIAPGFPLIFDEQAILPEGEALSYNASTGIVTFHKTGFYEVSFGVSIATPPNAPLYLFVSPIGIYPSGKVQGSECVIAFPNQMSTQTVVVQITIAGQTLQVLNGNLSSAGNNIHLHANSTAASPFVPVLAYMTIENL